MFRRVAILGFAPTKTQPRGHFRAMQVPSRERVRSGVISFTTIAVLSIAAACSDTPTAPPNVSGTSGSGGTTSAGAQTATAASSSATGVTSATGSTSDTTGSSVGTGGTTGAGGSGAGGAIGGGGSALTDASTESGGATDAEAGTTIGADVALGCGATHGTQADPGIMGDGTVAMAAPYNVPNEAKMRLNGAPAGTFTGPFMYESLVNYVGLKYQYWLYVPAQYKQGCRAALMVFQDALHYIPRGMGGDTDFNTPMVFDNLIHSGEMPVTIGLFVNPGEPNGIYNGTEGPNRSRQYDRANDTYSKFMMDELLPNVLLNKYDIIDDPDGWGIAGHSSGGICAFMVSWYRPDKFRKVLSHNASFPNTGGTFPNLINTTTPAKPLRVYLMSGPNDLNMSWYTQNTQAEMYLEAKGYHSRYRTETSQHFPPAAGIADLPDALRWLWRGYTVPKAP